MSNRGKYGVVLIVLTVAIALGALVGCEKSREPPAVAEPNEQATAQQPTHDQIAGTPALRANADSLKATVVTPHMAVPLEGDKNVLWCATFQMSWNELADLLGDKLAEYQGPSEMVPLLNQRSVTRDDLDEPSYVALAGYPTGGPGDILNRIEVALAEKFGGAASPTCIPSRRDLSSTDAVAYAYLFKSLPFEWPFGRSRKQGFSFEGSQVQAFGLGGLFWREEAPDPKAGRQVTIVDYQNDGDFIVTLRTKSDSDRLVLARIPAKTTLEHTIRSVQSRLDVDAERSHVKFKSVQVPVLNFDLGKAFQRLLRRGLTVQQIRFKLDETGAVLKSEAYGASVVVRDTTEPVDLIFDRDFLIMLQRKDAANPYFALWVANAELLVPVEGEP